MFLERLNQAVVEKCGVDPEKPILVGVSGGMDSLALFFGLRSLGYNLVVAHLDHGLRPESKEDAHFVQQIAESYQLPFCCQRIDVAKVAEAASQSIEEAAREVRYQFLFEQARAQGCQVVAVAHHADDQVETVLMHFLRGAALPGLTGMPYRRLMNQWDQDIPLVRPLLDTWREEIDAYVAEIGITACFDRSNLDTTYHRNRIRHELIPELETYNPKIKSVIWRMAEVLHEEDAYLDIQTQVAYKKNLVNQSVERITLDFRGFVNLSIALKRRVLRHTIAQLRPDLRDVGFEDVNRGLSFLEAVKSRGEIDLVARLNLAVIDDMLVFKTWEADLPDFGKPLLSDVESVLFLEPGMAVSLINGWSIQASVFEDNVEVLMKQVKELEDHEAWLDYDLLEMPLVIRGRREGERFRPIGMGGRTKRLQDYFVNLKISEHLRSRWPLVISGDEIAWVVGLRPSEQFKITNDTQRVLQLKLVKNCD